MITIKDIQKVIDKRARYITRDYDGTIRWFNDEPVSNRVDKCWVTNTRPGKEKIFGSLGKIVVDGFDHWHNWYDCCEELEPDYDDCIGKLCWFWDDDEEGERGKINQRIGILGGLNDESYAEYHFYDKTSNDSFSHCKPIKPEEVGFYKGFE